ncbi:MAG: BrnA antitoxin family protein [Burkholderiales bacterium]|nr:BrnA antitoxin family protein [Burkholderiales bacterium]
MTAKKRVSRRSLGSDLKRVDAHTIQRHEYDELPELTDDMLARGRINKGGRPRAANPRKLISIRLPESVIERWRATGPGWQARMAERLAKTPPK